MVHLSNRHRLCEIEADNDNDNDGDDNSDIRKGRGWLETYTDKGARLDDATGNGGTCSSRQARHPRTMSTNGERVDKGTIRGVCSMMRERGAIASGYRPAGAEVELLESRSGSPDRGMLR